MSRAIGARARTQPVRQIWVGQKLAANGNQIRIAFPEPCFRGKPSAATVRLMLSPSWRRRPRLQPLFGIRQHDGWTALGQNRKWQGSRGTSVLPSTADIVRPTRHVRKVPNCDIAIRGAHIIVGCVVQHRILQLQWDIDIWRFAWVAR